MSVKKKIDLLTWITKTIAEAGERNFIADEEPPILADAEISYSAAPLMNTEWQELNQLEDEEGFVFELARLIREKWKGTKKELCYKALLLENTFYKIQSGDRLPGRETTICLALALGLNLSETKKFLGYLGYGISPNFRRDYLIIKALKAHLTPLDTNILLEQGKLRLLGPEK